MKKILSLLCIGALFLSFVTTPSIAFEVGQKPAAYTVIENQAKLPILNPSLAERRISKIRLKNGLEAILVSDPNARQTAAAMTVNAGSWSEPNAYPGIAHFLEHMLFLGTKKFPNESEYQAYMSEHGGLANAFTANDTTSYLFTVNNDAAEGALDRFSDFFKEPLFNPSGVGRELKAIDQEFNKNIENDDIRELFILKELANPNHPQHRFTAGNSSTLSKVSQETLIDWYKKHYSAEIMHLIVYTALPLDKLTDIVVRDFSGIPAYGYKRLALNPSLSIHSDAEKGMMTFVQPVKNTNRLSLVWDLPSKFADMIDYQPDELVCYVLGHEGKESLLAELKREKLAESLKCGSGKIGPGAVEFYLEIELTNEGIQKYNQVIELVFQTIAMLKEKGIPPYLFNEIKKMDEIRYQYQPRKDGFDQVEADALDIVNENIATYPEHTQIVQKYDPALIKEYLDNMTPQNAIFMLMAPPQQLPGVTLDREEKWTGAHYTVKPIPEEWMKAWEQASGNNPNIELPLPNIFIPKDLKLVNQGIPQQTKYAVPHPKAIVNNSSALVYYAPDTYYRMPQIYTWFEIKTPEIQNGKTSKVVLGDLFVKSVNEAVSKFSYDAQMAGLDYTIETTDNGIGITLKGYSENAHLLFAEILKRLKEIHPSDDKFNIYKQTLTRQYQNAAKESPLTQATELFKSAIYKNYSTDKQKLNAIRKVNFEMYNQFATGIFNQTYVEGIVYGNITEDQAKAMTQQLLQVLGGKPYPKEDQPKKLVIELPANAGPFFIESTTKSKGNAVILAIEAEKFSLKERAAQQIIMQDMGQDFFETLRTKQQTGYIVGSSDEETERHLFDYFAVQSNSHNVRDLLARFELFIEQYLQEMGKTGFNEESFNVTKQSLLTILQQPQNSIEEAGKLLKTLAFKYDGDFDWIDKRIEGFKTLAYQEFLTIAKDTFGRQNKRRLAILLQGVIPVNGSLNYVEVDLNQLRKLSTYTGR